MENIKTLQNQKYIKSLVVIILGTALLTVSAKFKIPFYPVPMTMQTFVVLFIGIGFGYKIALATVSLYLIEGILGLPVFSNSPERGIGITYFTGPTMGYLLGFLSACYFSSYVKVSDNYLMIIIKLILSVSSIYILGVLWLGSLIGWDKPIFELGVAPFLLAEIFKLSLLVILTKKILKLRKFI